MNKETDKLVKDYIAKIKKSLPEYIKNKEDKLDDVISEISSHIWDSAYEISESDDPDVTSIQKAINKMGPPKEIAKSYKKSGTPKYYISEELWPSYQKFVFSVVGIIFSIMLVIQVVLVEPNNFLQAVINGITLSYAGITFILIIVTLLFIYFSTEGFFPGDFDTKSGSKKEKKFQYYKPGEFFFNGIAGIIIGLFIIILPLDMLNLFRIMINFIIGLFGWSIISEYVSISNELQLWWTLFGLIIVIRGVITLMKIQTKEPGFHITTNLFLLFTKIGDLGLTVYMILNIKLFVEILPLPENILLIMGVLSIFGNIGEIGKLVSQNIKLYDIFQDNKNNLVPVTDLDQSEYGEYITSLKKEMRGKRK